MQEEKWKALVFLIRKYPSILNPGNYIQAFPHYVGCWQFVISSFVAKMYGIWQNLHWNWYMFQMHKNTIEYTGKTTCYPLCAIMFWRNIKMYLHLLSFPNIRRAMVIKILRCGRQWSANSNFKPWLQMFWRLKPVFQWTKWLPKVSMRRLACRRFSNVKNCARKIIIAFSMLVLTCLCLLCLKHLSHRIVTAIGNASLGRSILFAHVK